MSIETLIDDTGGGCLVTFVNIPLDFEDKSLAGMSLSLNAEIALIWSNPDLFWTEEDKLPNPEKENLHGLESIDYEGKCRDQNLKPIVKNSMNSRLELSELGSGDVNPTGVYTDATGRTASSSTSTVQVNKVASIGGGCARGQLSTDSSGKLLSCESGRWSAPSSGVGSGGMSELLKAYEGQTITCSPDFNLFVQGRVINGQPQVRAYYRYGNGSIGTQGWISGLSHDMYSPARLKVEMTLGGIFGSDMMPTSIGTPQTCTAQWGL